MNTTNKTEKFWDRTADYYDKIEKRVEMTNLKFIEKAKKYVKVSDIVLDFGCGIGIDGRKISFK